MDKNINKAPEISDFTNPNIRFFDKPWQMNLELTNACPLKCPQCYIHTEEPFEMSLKTALSRLQDGALAGVKQVNLSGGETLCYPHLETIIHECKELNMNCAIAISGINATKEKLSALINAGVNHIFISLNGSTKEINEHSRDGFEHAIKALETLTELDFKNRHINFVMNRFNAKNLPGMALLCERYAIPHLAILCLKPDSKNDLRFFPDKDDMVIAADFINKYKGSVKITPEPCFSQLKALLFSYGKERENTGPVKGCTAGRTTVCVSADGRLSPCRHLDIKEDFEHISDYWKNSEFLNELRHIEDHRTPPCHGCYFEEQCLPCQAIGLKLRNCLNTGMTQCPLAVRKL